MITAWELTEPTSTPAVMILRLISSLSPGRSIGIRSIAKILQPYINLHIHY